MVSKKRAASIRTLNAVRDNLFAMKTVERLFYVMLCMFFIICRIIYAANPAPQSNNIAAQIDLWKIFLFFCDLQVAPLSYLFKGIFVWRYTVFALGKYTCYGNSRSNSTNSMGNGNNYFECVRFTCEAHSGLVQYSNTKSTYRFYPLR